MNPAVKRTLVELCCGTASVSLHALAELPPLTGYMGSKRRDAALLVDMLGAHRPNRVVLVDAGPWGDVWTTLRLPWHRRSVVALLRAWDRRGELPEVWPTLLYPPPDDPVERAAQYLCLQARTAGVIPIWWSAERSRWEGPTGSRTEAAHQRGGGDMTARMKRRGPCGPGPIDKAMAHAGSRRLGELHPHGEGRGLVRIATLAERVRRLDAIDWSRVEVVHGDDRQKVVTLEAGVGALRLLMPAGELWLRLVEGEFPAYQAAVPKRHKHVAMVLREDLAEALNRVRIVARDKYRPPRLSFGALDHDTGAPGLRIDGRHLDKGDAEEWMPCELKGEPLEVGLRARDLHSILSAMTGEHVRIEMLGEIAPVRLRDPQDDRAWWVTMPERLA